MATFQRLTDARELLACFVLHLGSDAKIDIAEKKG
jgi:hypothetical protein